MYHEVFESDYAGDKLHFSQDSWVLYTDLKNRAYDRKLKQQEGNLRDLQLKYEKVMAIIDYIQSEQ
jgi:hypothetical protein